MPQPPQLIKSCFPLWSCRFRRVCVAFSSCCGAFVGSCVCLVSRVSPCWFLRKLLEGSPSLLVVLIPDLSEAAAAESAAPSTRRSRRGRVRALAPDEPAPPLTAAQTAVGNVQLRSLLGVSFEGVDYVTIASRSASASRPSPSPRLVDDVSAPRGASGRLPLSGGWVFGGCGCVAGHAPCEESWLVHASQPQSTHTLPCLVCHSVLIYDTREAPCSSLGGLSGRSLRRTLRVQVVA